MQLSKEHTSLKVHILYGCLVKRQEDCRCLKEEDGG